jgi:hypothetical protein
MKPLARQLYDKWQKTNLTLDELGRLAGLDVSRGGLSRKLRGKQPMTTEEYEALNRALDKARARDEGDGKGGGK